MDILKGRSMFLLIFFLGISSVRGDFSLGDQSDADALIREGRHQYELIETGSKLPLYGKCWLSALDDLHKGCESLTDEVQSRIAIKFTNCFLAKAGLNTYECPESEAIHDCLRNVDHNAFTAYSNFFMHCRSMCYFVMSQTWHKATEGRIQGLGEASSKAINTFKEFAFEMQDVQRKNLEFQKSMLENGTMLSQALEASRTNVKDMLSEFRSSTDEQRSMIFEIFDRVSQLQNLVLSEVSWIYAVVFYGGSLLFVYVLTATKRTAEARLWLLLIISINFGIERAVTTMSLPANGDFVAQIREDLSSKLYERVWNVRKVCSLLCLLTLLYFAVKFKDYNKINNSLLEDIRKQNLELKKLMESRNFDLKQHQAPSIGVDSSEAGALQYYSHAFKDSRNSYDYEEDDSTSVDSFNSIETDRTFNTSRAIDLSDSDTVCEDDNMTEDENLSIFEGSLNLDYKGDDILLPDSTAELLDASTDSKGHTYNLRSRRSLNWNKGDWDNPILDAESPNSFAKLVNKMATIHKARSQEFIKSLESHMTADTSKDKSFKSTAGND